jgi:hypothetical protein
MCFHILISYKCPDFSEVVVSWLIRNHLTGNIKNPEFWCEPKFGMTHVRGVSLSYILRRYCPPTSNMAWVICPKEQTFTADIRASNKLPFSTATCCN